MVKKNPRNAILNNNKGAMKQKLTRKGKGTKESEKER